VTSHSAPSSKQTRRSDAFYRYYAGYPLEFALWVLDVMALQQGAMVVDPWNGSGTTTAACAERGLAAIGYDINPVMLAVARARIGSTESYARVLAAVSETAIPTSGAMPELAHAFVSICDEAQFNSDSDESSILLTALFPIARKVAAVAKSKNPSWFRALRDVPAIQSSWSTREIADNIKSIEARRPPHLHHVHERIAVIEHDARRRLKLSRPVDAILTSPPYLTRLDYVRATLPELLLLEQLGIVESIVRLRRSMLGTPLTTARSQRNLAVLPEAIQSILKQISEHSSKASNTYYHRFFAAYFFDLQASLAHVCRSLKSGGKACIVVQGSHYKEIRIDLAKLTSDILNQLGMEVDRFVEFDSPTSMVLVNRRAHSHARVPQQETAIFASKTGREF
jgi:SAM-dependent methyltransferase